jgi:WD40 repeat protein
VIYNNKDGGVVLWDLETNREMNSLWPLEETSFFPYQWSPDGTKFVTPRSDTISATTNNELYMVNMMDGKLEELTHFNLKYPYASVHLPAWSPDGHHIGFWLRIGDSNSDPRKLRQWLAVLDTDTLETTIYCLADKPQSGPSSGIVWSPDGQQLIVTFGSQLDGTLTPILVDLVHQTKAVLDTQNMLVEDWMAP